MYRFGEFSAANPFDRISSRMEINGPTRRRAECTPEQAPTLMGAAEQSGDENLGRAVLVGVLRGCADRGGGNVEVR